MKKALRDLLLDVARGELGPAIAARAQALLDGGEDAAGPEKAPIPSLSWVDARREREEAEEAEAKAQMRKAVFEWNLAHTAGPLAPHGRCDCGCGGRFSSATEGECDHWIERSQGGEHTRENGWRLLHRCHRRKTDNEPNRSDWNLRRQSYCYVAGIPFVPRKERP